jgi:hypothetical protein
MSSSSAHAESAHGEDTRAHWFDNGSIGDRLATTPRNPTANRQLSFTHVLPRTSQDSGIV